MARRCCNRCGVQKDLGEFSFRNRAKGTRNHTCRPCFTAYRREHYLTNRDAYVARNVGNARQRRRLWKERLWGYLAEHPCVECGEADPLVLEFDHREPAAKRADIYSLIHRCYAWETILAEIAKCDVRCANCHRRRTAEQFGWPKLGVGGLRHR